MRLLFASIHSYLDPSGGAVLSTRELLEFLAARGADCRVLTAGVLDYERETTLDEVLARLDLPSQRFRADLGPSGSFLSRGPTPIRRPRAHANAKQRSAEYDSTPDRCHR